MTTPDMPADSDMVMVPLRPTEAMIEAAQDQLDAAHTVCLASDSIEVVWHAMLSTRPTPATPEGLRPFGPSPLEIERIRSVLIDGLEKAYWAGSEVAQGFDAAKEADAILAALQPQAQGGE